MTVTSHRSAAALALMAAVLVAGCVLPGASPQDFEKFLQTVSAGHTGCQPADNQITNVNVNRVGNGTWNATCAGRVYLCSEVDALDSQHGAYSCALAVTTSDR